MGSLRANDCQAQLGQSARRRICGNGAATSAKRMSNERSDSSSMMRSLIHAVRNREVIGCIAASLAVLIFASYPVATRAGVTGSFAPQDLVLLRFGVGALFFLPYLLLHFPVIQGEVWRRGISLAVFQGAGMAGLVIFGLQ